MYVDPRLELEWLGEDPGGVLVRTPDGKEVMIEHSCMANYAKVGNKLIPKDNVQWL